MFGFLKKKKVKKKNIEVLKLDFDALFKVLLIVNSIFIIFFINATSLGHIGDWDAKGWGRFIGYIIMIIFDSYLIVKGLDIYIELRNKLSK